MSTHLNSLDSNPVLSCQDITAKELAEMPVDERSEALKSAGNEQLKLGKMSEAIQLYSEAIALNETAVSARRRASGALSPCAPIGSAEMRTKRPSCPHFINTWNGLPTNDDDDLSSTSYCHNTHHGAR